MSEKKHELYLIALALMIAAGLILYNVFRTPEFNKTAVPAAVTVQQSGTVSEKRGTSPLETVSAAAENTEKQETGSTKAVVVHTTDKTSKPAGRININTATKQQLMTLPGIGEVKATAIIEYRKENGHFKNIDALNNVKGIGEKIIERIRGFVTI